MRSEVTIVTHMRLPQGAPDDLIFAEALAALGCNVRFAVWNDRAIDWSATPLSIVRSTWDYHRTPECWLRWIDRASQATKIVNPPDVLKWNTDKRYLRALQDAGVACVPTVFLSSDRDGDLASVMDEHGWSDVVVKPAIGASASGTQRFRGQRAQQYGSEHAGMLMRRGTVLVQPYLDAVEHERERSLVFIGGAFSHAFSKSAFNTNATGDAMAEPHTPSAEEICLAGQALAVLETMPVFARVDLVPSQYGLVIMELELIEPDLALRLFGHAARSLASACLTLAYHELAQR